MKKIFALLFALLLILVTSVTTFASDVGEFLSRDVSIDGYSVSGHMKMWQTIGLEALPVVLVGAVILVSYVQFKRGGSLVSA